MRRRVRWITSVSVVLVFVGLFASGGVPASFAAPRGKPGVTPPGVPPGQPFQALQREIDALDGRVDALEAEASQPGLMWINPLDFRGGSTLTLALDATVPGLAVTGGPSSDVLQVGLQVPLGFAVTGVRICYQEGALGAVLDTIQILQNGTPTPIPPPAVKLTESLAPPPGLGALACFDTVSTTLSVDPSAGGALFLSLHFTAPVLDTVILRGVGLHLTP